MQLKNQRQNGHLTDMVNLLSMYHAVTFTQLLHFYPDLNKDKIRILITRLEKAGRASYQPESELLLSTPATIPTPETTSALWVLLDFLPEITYHSASDFPVVLTFFTTADCYDVIYVPKGKEILFNHALSVLKTDVNRRLAVVESPYQMKLLNFPGISAFCVILPEGKVQYFKKKE